MKNNLDEAIVGIIDLGYVGLSLFEAFFKSLRVTGFDIESDRVAELSRSNNNRSLIFTDDTKKMAEADFIIICVPTLVTKSR